MKHADQNEVDLLLRSLARNAGVSSAQSYDALSEHLDADELNAFAEGVLPEAARIRYSAHLADCPGCRGIVINLTQAAGIAVRPTAVTEGSPSSLMQKLGALFSQPVLKFVVPAIVLASILGIGLLVLQQQDQPGEFIAKHEPSQQTPSVDHTNQAKSEDSPLQTEASSRAAATPLQPVATLPSEAPRGESESRAAGAGVSQEPPIARKEADAQPKEATPTFAPDLNAPAAPPPLPASPARDRGQTLAKEEAAKREEAKQADEVKVQTDEGADDRRKLGAAAKAGTRPAQPGNVQGLMSERSGDEDKNKRDSTGRADSRTVSGKRFVRQNNSWVDSAYDSSRGTTNVKRGSEQYRALVADEPGLRPFAEQLSGEVIVVWKRRAYRFY